MFAVNLFLLKNRAKLSKFEKKTKPNLVLLFRYIIGTTLKCGHAKMNVDNSNRKTHLSRFYLRPQYQQVNENFPKSFASPNL